MSREAASERGAIQPIAEGQPHITAVRDASWAPSSLPSNAVSAPSQQQDSSSSRAPSVCSSSAALLPSFPPLQGPGPAHFLAV